MTELKVEYLPLAALLPYTRNSRTHSDEQVAQIAGSIREFGFTNPVLVDNDGGIIAGHGRVRAASLLTMSEVPCIRLGHLTATQRKAYVIADNRLALNAGWDTSMLTLELQDLGAENFQLELLGFEDDELKELLNPEKSPTEGLTDPDAVPEITETRCKPGDLWQLGNHRLLCGDSTNVQHIERLMGGEKADMVFTDPPYGLGGYGGRNNMALEGDDQDPTGFYQAVPLEVSEIYVWGRVENWQHINFKPRDVIVWRKNNFGLGRGYRGQYEVCFYRGSFDGSDSDVWDVPKDITYQHPTQKPVALAERAIINSRPNIVLDLFLGSGSTLIACENTNRRCFGMEIDAHYCDVILKRWEQFTGKAAVLACNETVGS